MCDYLEFVKARKELEDRRKIYSSYLRGYSLSSIAGIMEMPGDEVESVIKTEPDEIRKQYAGGVKKDRLVELYNIPVEKIDKIINHEEPVCDRADTVSAEGTKNAIRMMRDSGMGIDTIATMYLTDRDHIQKILDEK